MMGLVMSDVETHASAEAAIVLSAEHYPVLLITWFGDPTLATAEAYASWLERMARRARAAGDDFVIVGDTSRVRSKASPELRQNMASGLETFQQIAGDHLLGVFTVVTNGVTRTIIRMTLYLTRRKLPFTPAKTMDEALNLALARLDEAGVPRPAGLDPARYTAPSHPIEED